MQLMVVRLVSHIHNQVDDLRSNLHINSSLPELVLSPSLLGNGLALFVLLHSLLVLRFRLLSHRLKDLNVRDSGLFLNLLGLFDSVCSLDLLALISPPVFVSKVLLLSLIHI